MHTPDRDTNHSKAKSKPKGAHKRPYVHYEMGDESEWQAERAELEWPNKRMPRKSINRGNPLDPDRNFSEKDPRFDIDIGVRLEKARNKQRLPERKSTPRRFETVKERGERFQQARDAKLAYWRRSDSD